MVTEMAREDDEPRSSTDTATPPQPTEDAERLAGQRSHAEVADVSGDLGYTVGFERFNAYYDHSPARVSAYLASLSTART
jgi:hypothetical protein